MSKAVINPEAVASINDAITNYLQYKDFTKAISSWTASGNIYRATIDNAFDTTINGKEIVSVERLHNFSGDESVWINGIMNDSTYHRLYVLSATNASMTLKYRVWYK